MKDTAPPAGPITTGREREEVRRSCFPRKESFSADGGGPRNRSLPHRKAALKKRGQSYVLASTKKRRRAALGDEGEKRGRKRFPLTVLQGKKKGRHKQKKKAGRGIRAGGGVLWTLVGERKGSEMQSAGAYDWRQGSVQGAQAKGGGDSPRPDSRKREGRHNQIKLTDFGIGKGAGRRNSGHRRKKEVKPVIPAK